MLGVTQQETYPVLWHYSFPGSRTSMVSSCCSTSDPSDVMFNILSDARTNYDIDKIEMQNSVEVIGPDGTKVNVSKWLKPLGEGEVRSNRPRINVEEIEDKLENSLIGNKTFEKSDLEESFHHMSLDNDGNDSLNLSITSANFDPEYKKASFLSCG